MADDIEYGDGVVKILDELANEESKANESGEIVEEARRKSETLSFEEGVAENSSPETDTNVGETSATIKPKEKFERRKKRAKENYAKRKKSLRDLRKKTFATIIPIPTPILDLANYLIAKAEIGVYKIAQFAEELKAAAKNRGYNANDFISGIKAFYIDKATSVAAENPELLENFSTPKEIVDFHFDDTPIIKQPVVIGSAQEMQDQINAETEKINKVLSSHYDTIVNIDGGVEVYNNREACVNARFDKNVLWQKTVQELDALLDDEQAYRAYITELFEHF